jgi:periplasmic protein TonB
MDNPTATPATANDRFKRGFGDRFWYSIAAAAVFHLMIFAFWPEMIAADLSRSADQSVMIDLPPEVIVPPTPEQIARPATPVESTVDIDDSITIPPNTFEANPIDHLAPPPTSARDDDRALAPHFTPMTVRPELRNQPEVQRALVRNYPPLLRDAGIGGTPVVWFLIDEDGRVVRTQLSRPSGYAALDEAALAVAQVMRFSPALNRDRRVQVWVEIPIVFTAR